VVVNRAFANKFFPGESAVGKKFGDTELSPKSMVQIVGVIENVKDGSLAEEDQPTVYNPFNQTAPTYFSLLSRTSQNSDSMLPTLGEAIHAVNRDAGLQASATMEDRIASSQPAYLHRVTAYLVGGFAAMALLLGAVGIYGIVAYSVSRRTREIGVRMALGAERGSVYRLIFGEAGRLIAIGIALGLAGSVEAAFLMRKLLFGVSAWDGPTLVGVSILLGGSALLASFVPACRAASVSPVEALRAE
jgi:macrolide transport system ATP-binding/permease protein